MQVKDTGEEANFSNSRRVFRATKCVNASAQRMMSAAIVLVMGSHSALAISGCRRVPLTRNRAWNKTNGDLQIAK